MERTYAPLIRQFSSIKGYQAAYTLVYALDASEGGCHLTLDRKGEREQQVSEFVPLHPEAGYRLLQYLCENAVQPVLQALRQERCFDVLVLSSQLEDMDSLTFLEKLNRLPSHPPLLLQGDGWADDITAAHLQPGSRFYGVGHDHLRDLLRGLLGVPGRNSMQIERFCTHLYELWKLPQPDTNCEYLTLAVQIACSADGKLALRKEILQGVAEQYHITVAAVDSGLRRLVEGLETRYPVEWEHFKAENGLTGLKVTTGRLVYSLQQTVLRRGIIVREQR